MQPLWFLLASQHHVLQLFEGPKPIAPEVNKFHMLLAPSLWVELDAPEWINFVGQHGIAHINDLLRIARVQGNKAHREPTKAL